jgi:hypothetical protein
LNHSGWWSCAFGQQGDAGHEAEGLDEVLEAEAALQMLALHSPGGEFGGQAGPGFIQASRPSGHLSARGGRMALHAPSLADIEQLAQAAAERLPDLFRQHLHNVILRIEDFPDEEVMQAMELESPYDILGLYWGHHVGDPGAG